MRVKKTAIPEYLQQEIAKADELDAAVEEFYRDVREDVSTFLQDYIGELQDKPGQIAGKSEVRSQKSGERLTPIVEQGLILSFLMGMDHAGNDIELAEVLPKPVTFTEAVKLFKSNIPLTATEYYELEKKLRFRAFTVSKLTQLDAIAACKDKLTKVLDKGQTLSEFWEAGGKDELLQAAGFSEQSPWYWETVFRTNIHTAYNTGRAMQYTKQPQDYYEFIGILDERQTEICRARSGVILPANDKWWKSNWPPLHFNCRSTVRAVYAAEKKIRDLGVTPKADLTKVKTSPGFGGWPLDTGSFYKITLEMKQRAGEYGIWGEIQKVGKQLGVSIQ